jgi:phosphoglycerate dehydrogenase-like enzyme
MVRYAKTHNNLIISPHIGGCTVESQKSAMEHTVSKFVKALRELPAR